MKKIIIIVIGVLLVVCILASIIIASQWQNITNQINIASGKVVTETKAPRNEDNSKVDESDNQNNDSSSTGTDVCAILTLDIAKQILGTEAKQASQNNGNCTYSAMSDTDFGILVMVVSKSSNSAEAKIEFEGAKTMAYDNTTESVSGLNVDEAYYAANLKQLVLLKGDSWMIISGTSAKYTSEKDLAIATAKLIYK